MKSNWAKGLKSDQYDIVDLKSEIQELEKTIEENKTKLFFDENMIKQSFQKKKITKNEKTDEYKKKLQKK